ncbi:MAG: hypothetical protein V3V92_02605 [Candidatus Hydrothermarchaeales archaeon]
MKPKHTPGPWHISGLAWEYGNDLTIYAETETYKNPWNIGRAYGPGNLVRQSEETRANARLIAAAPDLLEAIQLLLTSPAEDVKVKGQALRAVRAMREAIAKALGKD